MAHYGRLSDSNFLDTENVADDIRGATVYDLDDNKLGKIDDVIFDHTTGNIHYVIVDTGRWLSSKKFILPPQQVFPSQRHEGEFTIDLNKNQIERFPPYDESAVEAEEKWRDYESRYQESWVSGAVQHREGSEAALTPTPETAAKVGSVGAAINPTAGGARVRWSNLEDRLRQRRKEIISRCDSCREESQPGTASERERDEIPKAS